MKKSWISKTVCGNHLLFFSDFLKYLGLTNLLLSFLFRVSCLGERYTKLEIGNYWIGIWFRSISISMLSAFGIAGVRGLKKTKNQLLPKNISSKSLTVFILDQTERMWDNLYLVTFVVSTFNVAFPFSFTQSKLIIFLKKTSILVLGGKTISYFFQVLCRYYYLLMMIIDIHIFCYIFSMARSFIPRRVRFN